jgi:hypothetical protein
MPKKTKMTLKKIKELLQAEVITGEDCLDIEISFAGGSDLMSDVLAFGKPGILLAREKGIPLLSTKFMMYTTCGLLFSQGLPGVNGLPHKE